MKPLKWFLCGYLVMHLVLAVIFLHATTRPVLWLGTFALALAALGWQHGTRGRSRVASVVNIAMIPVMAAVVLGTLKPEFVDTYANWWPGVAATLLAMLIFENRPRVALAALVVTVASDALVSVVFLGWTMDAVQYGGAALMSPVPMYAGASAVAIFLRRMAGQRRELRDVDAWNRLAREQYVRSQVQQDFDVEVMRMQSLPLLQQISVLHERSRITGADRDRWEHGALGLRDELAARQLLSMELRAAVRCARARGVAVELQDGMRTRRALVPEQVQVLRQSVLAACKGDRLMMRRLPEGGVAVVFMGDDAETWLAEVNLPVDSELMEDDGVVYLRIGTTTAESASETTADSV
ncbi:hypothetical protein [Arthrobacter roseus]|uniref:hypothetical protein n=1 Tax=Arthrobacter roseus TaxID=136274 RepID=UPI0019665784|nr:hypothetical protein [Arthrobacter roseus]MBM7849713.1 hypothetical protein [Arthrobacter roseus]